MASYFSSILTSTTSRVASIRNNLLASDNDGDTEDDTHLCRVLRAYYTEKGRAFPAWLPPDPKAPPPVIVQPVYASNVGSKYGGMNTAGVPGVGGANNFNSLWDTTSSPAAPPPEQSLRAGRGRMGQGTGAEAPQRRNPFLRSQTLNAPAPVQARPMPMPSERAGSYQTAVREESMTPPGSSSGGMSAKEMMRKRFDPKKSRPEQMPASGSRTESYGSQNSSGSERPYVGANSPWANGEGFGGGDGGSYEPPPRRQIQGLPSGPGAGRRGPGLPSGPRGMR